MKVLLDTNVFISALLTPDTQSPSIEIVKAATEKKFTLLVVEELLDELVKKLIKKPYLRERITAFQAEWLVKILHKFATQSVTPITEKISIARDPKDDYLLAYAVVGKADYLVTGDEDLLVLKKIGKVKIVSPRKFVNVLIKYR